MDFSIGKIIFFTAIIFLIEYYNYKAIVLALSGKNPNRRRKAITIYIVFTAIVWLLTLTFWKWTMWLIPGSLKAILIAVAFGMLVAKVLMAAVLFIGDILRGIGNIFKFKSIKERRQTNDKMKNDLPGKITRSTFLARFALLLGGLSVGLFTWGTRNRYRYQLIKIKLTIEDLPEQLKGLKIVQISDIHCGSFDNPEAVEEGIDLAMAQNADLIVFTGDLVNQKADELLPYLQILGKLNAPLGVYSILGNHDYGDYMKWSSEQVKKDNLQTLKQLQKDMGWKLLLDEHVILNKNETDFALIGVENWSALPRFPRKGSLKKAYSGLENKNLPLQILLSHDPTHWDAKVNQDYSSIDLTLSGHTHGFQFGFEIPGFKWSPARFTYKQWAGLYSKNKQHLYINRGYGFVGYQGRVGILPEITLIELV